ncbi:putative Ovate family protein 6 [Tripterygium wilfordii]|uniref:Transcription repressor n=1 Tax=Tripterygium wilfordii TaxID=458696 RepID=A0A7J7DF05_TRIWF|nr:transcription repressor OFP2-like [Tripterygium wilfordii]KAF5744903.1 putative Ovate family protein 6 [Tripterygium wilfordii]
MSSKKQKLLRAIFTASAGCGCGRPKPADVYEPITIPKTSKNPKIMNQCSSSSNGGISIDEKENYTSTTISFNVDNTSTRNSEYEIDPRPSKNMPSPCPKITDSIAVEKDSSNPYQDFRHSMLQMIFEKEIYCKDDLQELLKCFLELNSPCFHDVIVKAFKEIWNDIVSKSPVFLGS